MLVATIFSFSHNVPCPKTNFNIWVTFILFGKGLQIVKYTKFILATLLGTGSPQPCVLHRINPLPDNKILDWSKLKQIADNILKCI